MPISINRWSAHPYFFINGELDYRVVKALKREMSFFVEGFERTKKYKEGRWDGQECLLYKSKAGNYFFPCGMIDIAKRVFGDFEIDYFIQDIKLDDVKKNYKPLDLKWTGHDLRDYQTKAVMDIKTNEGGTICLPTGAGKTLIMLRLAYEFNLPFLVLVHTKELLYQWEKNIKTYFNGRCPGLVGDGYSNFDPITIGMMQTLSQKIVKEKMGNLDYPIIMVDECFPYNTEVITETGVMKIGDIVRGKIGVKVLTHTGKFKRVVGWYEKPVVTNMVRVNHERGSFECTEDHKILTDIGWVRAKYLVCGSVVYNYNDVHSKVGICKVQDLRERVSIVSGVGWSHERSSQTPGTTKGSRVEICCTSDSGTGCCENAKVLGNNEVETVNCLTYGHSMSDGVGELVGRYEHWIREFTKPVSEVESSSRFEAVRVCSVEILSAEECRKNPTPDCEERGVWGVPNSIQHPEPPVFGSDLQYHDVKRRKENDHGRMAKSDIKPNGSCDMVHGRWRSYGEDVDVFSWEGISNGIYYNIRMVKKQVGHTVEDIQSDESMGSGDNAKTRSEEVSGSCETVYNSNDGIQDEYTVFDITVEDDHSYTANGVVVSNCHRAPADTAYMVAMHCNAPVRIGASATPIRTDGADLKIWAACGEIKTTITADELIKRKILAKPNFVFLTAPPIYAGKRSHYADVYLQGIVINEGRNELIIDNAKKYAKDGNIVYIHVDRIDHGEMLKERIPGSVFLSGRDGTTVRQGVLKKYARGDIPVLISTLLKEGVDIPTMNVFIAASAGKSPIGVLQKAGRALRTAPGKDSATIIDFRDSGKYLGDHWSERYNIYKTTFGEYCP